MIGDDERQPVPLEPGTRSSGVIVVVDVIQVQKRQDGWIVSHAREMVSQIAEVEFRGKCARDHAPDPSSPLHLGPGALVVEAPADESSHRQDLVGRKVVETGDPVSRADKIKPSVIPLKRSEPNPGTGTIAEGLAISRLEA
jgi:hypothetical protein